MVERSRSHQIDKRACKIFDALVPDGWVAREQHPDYAVDFRVEIYEPKDPRACGDLFVPTYPTGEFFAVQVKGSADPKGNDEDVTYALKVDHLAYYVDKEPQPVFLVVIDTITEDAYWIFVQEYADEHLADVDWRVQETITVRLPRSKLLKFDAHFHQIVKRAIEYMATRSPVAINSAIAAAQRKLERTDPRFDVKLVAEAGRLTRKFTLKPSATMDCHFEFGDDDERGSDFWVGKQVRFLPGEVRLDSVLFDKVHQVEGLIQVGVDTQATLLLTRKDALTVGLFFRGVITNGLGGVSYESEPGPIRLSSKALFSESGEPSAGRSVHFDLSFWYGKPVSNLVRFDEIERFFNCYGDCTVSTQWIVDGLPGEPGEMVLQPLPDDLQRLFRAIKLARDIGNKLGFYPTLPRNFGEIHWLSIERLHSLLFQGECCHDGDGDKITVSFSLDSEWQTWREKLKGRRHHRVSMRGRFTKDYAFLEHRVTLIMTEITIDRVTCRRPAVDYGGKSVELAFTGVEESQVVLRATGEVDSRHALGNSEDNPLHLVLHVDPSA